MLCSLSNLTSKNLDEIRSMEADVGQTLLAFSCHELSPAKLGAEKLKKIQSLEKKLGVTLVAVSQ